MSQQVKISVTATTIVTQRGVLRALNVEIRERQCYKREQEKIIEEVIETGNTRLMALHHDIELAKKQLRDLKTDIRTAAQDKVMLQEDIKTLTHEADAIARKTGMANAYA